MEYMSRVGRKIVVRQKGMEVTKNLIMKDVVWHKEFWT